MAKPAPGEGQSDDATGSANAMGAPPNKKKKHRAGRKHRKPRRQSFIAPSEAATEDTTDMQDRPSLLEASHHASQRDSFYRVQNSTGRGSHTSLESEALLDHREHAPLSRRRDTMRQAFARAALPFARHQHRPSDASAKAGGGGGGSGRSRPAHTEESVISEDEEDEHRGTERSPLLGNKARTKPHVSRANSGLQGGTHSSNGNTTRTRHESSPSKTSSPRGAPLEILTATRNPLPDGDHDVNNPPSVPGSPTLGITEDLYIYGLGSSLSERGRDAVIHINEDEADRELDNRSPESMRRRPTLAQLAERDVCFPGDDDATEHGEESPHASQREASVKPRRRRGRKFPDLEVLEEWSREEKEARTQQEVQRAKKISEPVMIGGRLRPAKTAWHAEAENSPFRFTYFNEMLDGTIHARTISDLQDDMTFHELFIPDPIELSDDSDDEDEHDEGTIERPTLHKLRRASSVGRSKHADAVSQNGDLPRPASIARGSIVESMANSKSAAESAPVSGGDSGNVTPKGQRKRYGPRPTFWLDVLSPTENEMKVLSKAFGIHQLTSEDILMNEQREKVELFPSYYFVNYRTFEQDKDSENYMEPINMYVIVFRDGVITFHHSMSPHPANVRRRIRQLSDYMSPTADWISYAIIDDVTDVYAPLVTEIEQEVDDIDEEILLMHQESDPNAIEQAKFEQKQKEGKAKGEKRRESNASATTIDAGKKKNSGGDMLRRVGGCRKKVMSLYRLLGNKADVIKGFAKRCNEHWEVAPRSEIGLYLGDIQDHIVTMTGNLSHYERYVQFARLLRVT